MRILSCALQAQKERKEIQLVTHPRGTERKGNMQKVECLSDGGGEKGETLEIEYEVSVGGGERGETRSVVVSLAINDLSRGQAVVMHTFIPVQRQENLWVGGQPCL